MPSDAPRICVGFVSGDGKVPGLDPQTSTDTSIAQVLEYDLWRKRVIRFVNTKLGAAFDDGGDWRRARGDRPRQGTMGTR
jgi:hypothetical protein